MTLTRLQLSELIDVVRYQYCARSDVECGSLREVLEYLVDVENAGCTLAIGKFDVVKAVRRRRVDGHLLLSDADVVAIRNSDASLKELSCVYGISVSMASAVRRRRAYANVHGGRDVTIRDEVIS